MPIFERQELASTLWRQIGSTHNRGDTGFDAPELYADPDIVGQMLAAINGQKARDLYEGRWQQHHASQSEADFALVDIIAFYSDNWAQVARIFRQSALGQRAKAQRDDYLGYMIGKAFDRKVPPVDASQVIANLKALAEAEQTAIAAGLPAFPASCAGDMPTVDVAAFEGQPIEPRPWLVQGVVPGRTVTGCYGDGGGGKSLVFMQLCVSTILGRGWIGSAPIAQGRALYVAAEDDLDEIHRRLADIARAEDVRLSDLRGLTVVPLADRDALLAVQGRGKGTLEPTPLYAALAVCIAARRPNVVVIDTLADTYGGNEIDRSQARQFINMLRRLAIEFDTAVVLLAHPSQAGMNSGSGTSGSTGWNNSVRSRLYLKRDERNPNIRVLEVMKSNYGAIGQSVQLRWEQGVFWNNGSAPDRATHVAIANSGVDDLFLQLMADFAAKGQSLSPSPQSPTRYAPKLMANCSLSSGITEAGFKAAMVRLIAAGRIAHGVDRRHRREAATIELVQ